MDNNTIGARQLRMAVVTNFWKQLHITEQEAKELLALPLNPDDPTTLVDDSALLGDPLALEKIAAELSEAAPTPKGEACSQGYPLDER